MNTKTIHLSGLNGLRAIAALAVVISHTTQALGEFGLNPFVFGKTPEGAPRGMDMAGFGVSIFFCLSGFLITYLLLLEKTKTEINIKHFYLRRILRIWPLYYLYLVACILVILSGSGTISVGTILMYIFYAANVPFILNTALPYLAHYWSLGVEEQFYSFWPWIVKKSGRKLLFIVTGLTILLIGLKLVFRIFIPHGDESLPYKVIHVTRFHCMMIGAIGAILYFDKNRSFIQLITHKLSQLAAWMVMLLIALNRFHIASVIDNELVSMVALVLIMGQITKQNRIVNLEGNVFDFLGKISYGIYVIHPLIIYGYTRLLGNFNNGLVLKYIIVYGSIIGTTIILAYLSYQYYEKWFLTLKHKYSVIRTSPSKYDNSGSDMSNGMQIMPETVRTA